MQKEIRVKNESVSYFVKSVRRSKSVRIIVHRDGKVVVTKPFWLSIAKAENFLQSKIGWVMKKAQTARLQYEENLSGRNPKEEYELLKKEALAFAVRRVAEINAEFYGFSYGKISVRNQKTRWGSCSKAGNLSFHYRILLLPSACADYLIAHELCHLKEFNHSERFWKLVSLASPNYRSLRIEMKDIF